MANSPLAAAAGVTPAVVTAVLTYSACSASLLLVNKYVMTLVPSAPLVTAIQCLFCIVAIGGGALAFDVPRLGDFSPALLRAYALYTVLFVLGIYSNMRALEESNVDTVIVFRAATPLLVAAADWALMGREAPSARSLASMLVVAVGCAAFVTVDRDFELKGLRAYAWVSVYVVCIAAEMVLGKQITSKHDAPLGASVFLTNAFALVPFLAIGASTGELARGLAARFTPFTCAVLVVSCALSAGIGFTSWWARSLVSATTFTVVGTVNKIATVLLNIVVWNKHATPLGTLFLLVCLAAGALYQQAPLRAAPFAKVPLSDVVAEEEARAKD
jgi:drug/metabolite transporter (DMT)-like permease